MADIPNGVRGDVGITLGGKEYVLRPTYQALIEIERMTGGTMTTVARRILDGDIGMGDATAIITAGLKAAGEPATTEAVGKMVYDAGLLNVGVPLVQFCTNGLTGGDVADKGEAAAVSQTEESHTEDSPPLPTAT